MTQIASEVLNNYEWTITVNGGNADFENILIKNNTLNTVLVEGWTFTGVTSDGLWISELYETMQRDDVYDDAVPMTVIIVHPVENTTGRIQITFTLNVDQSVDVVREVYINPTTVIDTQTYTLERFQNLTGCTE